MGRESAQGDLDMWNHNGIATLGVPRLNPKPPGTQITNVHQFTII